MRILDVRGKSGVEIDRLSIHKYRPSHYSMISAGSMHRETTDADIKAFQKLAEKEGAEAMFIQEYGLMAFVPIRPLSQEAQERKDRSRKKVEVLNSLAQERFGKPFDDLSVEAQDLIYFSALLRDLLPQNLPQNQTLPQTKKRNPSAQLKTLLPQTERGRITGIKKGREYWPKVNATQRAILSRMNAGTIFEIRSNGDLTFEAEGKQYILATTGELFVGQPGQTTDRRGPMPQTRLVDKSGLEYYKVPPSAF